MNDHRAHDTSPTDTSTAEVLARITDAVFALDEEWRFSYLNEQAERVLQRDEDDLLGTVIWDAFPEAAGSTFQREYEHAMETQEPVKFEEFYPPLDTWLEVRAYPSETGLSVYFQDVTERVRQQNELRERERALHRAYEIIGDPDLSFPQQVDALLSVVREAIGTDFATLSRVHPDANRYIFGTVDVPDDVDLQAGDSVPLVELPNCAHVVETEQTLVLKDVEAEAPELADPTWSISCYLGAPVSVEGKIYGTFCFYGMEARSEEFSDWEVTFVELLSNWVGYELQRQRQNDRLDSFAGMLAHELRNPLQIAQLYHPQAADGDEAAAEEVVTALDRIEELIDIILVVARGTDSVIDWEAVELADVATETWTDVAVDDAELVVETDQLVEADPIHFQHLLKNLFTNAVEHGGSNVTVRVGELPTVSASEASGGSTDESVGVSGSEATGGSEDEQRESSGASSERSEDEARQEAKRTNGGFCVADDGPGIPEDERGQVFEAGYTTEEGGIGLGLTFVAQLADTYDWEWQVTESDEGGARFEFTGVTFVSEA